MINNSPMETRVRRDGLTNFISIVEFIVCFGSAFDSFIEDVRGGGVISAPNARLMQDAVAIHSTSESSASG